ncbi:pyrroline-5-carboxylate reductase 1, mitochondrial-like isoform X2 [Hetaerina americana]|uniref:pyrroline-5-carboxylate reductase 1, mitochondrial-like isoform X2 n=1 Tax=Hetaerina americana TaxID=62018 RepID=UPI003A7F5FF3
MEGIVPSENIMISSPTTRTFATWKKMGAETTHDNGKVVEAADIIFLTVKPHILDSALSSINVQQVRKTEAKLFVSVIAGVTLRELEQKLINIGFHPRVVRVMPNTPVTVGFGCSVYCGGTKATANDMLTVNKMLSAGGICEEVPENLINAVGALAGSGPAYIYLVIEALADGGVKMGVPRNMATKFAAQTVLGAAQMVLETGRHPGQLKDEVCSPGGTTIAGIHAMERAGVRAGLMDAVEAAKKRCDEIGATK